MMRAQCELSHKFCILRANFVVFLLAYFAPDTARDAHDSLTESYQLDNRCVLLASLKYSSKADPCVNLANNESGL